MPRPIEDLKDALDPLLAGFTKGVDLFAGPERPEGAGVPHKAIFCNPTPSPTPTRLMRSVDIRTAAVQIRIRGDVGKFEETEALARTVWLAARDMDVTASPLTDYLSVFTSESEPNPLGRDDRERFVFTVNVEMTYVET